MMDTQNTVDIVVDLETLGTMPGSIILGIGAIAILNGKIIQSFDYVIDMQSCCDMSMTLSTDTLKFWNGLNSEIRNKYFNGTVHITQVLTTFYDWIQARRDSNRAIRIWGNAARFDLGLLEAAYNMAELEMPWNYREEMCFRTLKEEWKDTVLEPVFVGTKHDALDDALHEAKWLIEIQKYQAEKLV